MMSWNKDAQRTMVLKKAVQSFGTPCFVLPFLFFVLWFCKTYFVLLLILFLSASPLSATTHQMSPEDADLIGIEVSVKGLAQDTLLDIARQYDLRQEEILLANPDVDRWLPGNGTEIVLPGRFILPRAERKGIVLNLPEMRLYYFYRDSEKELMVKSYPVSIGRMDWNTPLGTARIEKKDRDPSWRPPESLKLEAAAKGDPLPDVVPPGPDNPLGNYALRLSIPGYLIHSTNKPYGVGMRVTHGCVRMYPEDIEELFPLVPLFTTVHIRLNIDRDKYCFNPISHRLYSSHFGVWNLRHYPKTKFLGALFLFILPVCFFMIREMDFLRDYALFSGVTFKINCCANL